MVLTESRFDVFFPGVAAGLYNTTIWTWKLLWVVRRTPGKRALARRYCDTTARGDVGSTAVMVC